MQNTLEIDSIYKYVSPDFKLSDIFLKCETGDILGIFGRNGAGKSLLLKLIFGIINAENKNIRLNRNIIDKLYLIPQAVAYLPQHSFLPKNITIHKILSLYLPKNHSDFTEDSLLKKLLFLKPSEISTGELRYLEIKLLLCGAAKFVLLDEPLSTLSPVMKEKVLLLIKEASAHKGIIICDHDYFSLKPYITDTFLMHCGSLKRIGSEAELKHWNYLP